MAGVADMEMGFVDDGEALGGERLRQFFFETGLDQHDAATFFRDKDAP
jgi:hypothetical protein